MVDDSLVVNTVAKRSRRPMAEKRRIVEETMQPGASVARVAGRHGINANQVFYWRSLYRRGLLSESRDRGGSGIDLLSVKVADGAACRRVQPEAQVSSARAGSAIFIEFAKAQVRIEGSADAKTLGVVLEYLLR